MRKRFDEQLEDLNLELIKMGALCEEAIESALELLIKGDASVFEKTIHTDSEIDHKEHEIETMCIRLLLQQQPVAKDLRVVSSAMRMISDMERIGDQAYDIAEIARYVGRSELINKIKINEMSVQAQKMVTDSIESFVKKDLALARYVMDYDDVVDKLFTEIKQNLIGVISSGEGDAEICLDLLMIAKYLERIGDHATNIAEHVEYSITGELKERYDGEE